MANQPERPLVTICTLTHNRSKYIQRLWSCIRAQDYPKDKIEWLILDDSDNNNSIEMEFKGAESIRIKRQRARRKMILGEKRNLSHKLCSGDVIVYMDDDDFYFPQRVSHAVESLESSGREIAGSTILPIYFELDNQLWISGPFGENHATANTFAMTKTFAMNHLYDPTATCNEEKSFLNDYTIPMVQLDPWKSIICMSHNSNTFDKRKMRQGGEHSRMRRITVNASSQVARELGNRDFFPKPELILDEQKRTSAEDQARSDFKAAGENANCDKVTHHGYERIYPLLIRSTVNPENLLEIGYGNGASAHMWKELYPNCNLTILDKDVELSGEGLCVMRCDQSSPEALSTIKQRLRDNHYDLIIDDGSHVPSHQIQTWNHFFDCLKEGGWYVIEDIETSYWKKGTVYGYSLSAPGDNPSKSPSCVETFKCLSDYINREFTQQTRLKHCIAYLEDSGIDINIANKVNAILFFQNLIAINKSFKRDEAMQSRNYRFKKNIDENAL